MKSRDTENKGNINSPNLLTKPNGGAHHLTIVTRSDVSEAARLLGKIKTPKKAKASRENGKLGGRPRKKRKAA